MIIYQSDPMIFIREDTDYDTRSKGKFYTLSYPKIVYLGDNVSIHFESSKLMRDLGQFLLTQSVILEEKEAIAAAAAQVAEEVTQDGTPTSL